MTVAIVDFGMCNLDSVSRGIEACGGVPLVTDRPAEIVAADRIVLPGVGAFTDAMTNLRRRSLDDALSEAVIEQGVPCLGICLGMQLMASRGLEGGEMEGLGWIEGEIRRFESEDRTIRVPHVGWNAVDVETDGPLFRDIPSGTDFYFVHSFHFVCADRADVVGMTTYCGRFVSAVSRGHIHGVQFHAEKSQRWGLQVLRNFLALR